MAMKLSDILMTPKNDIPNNDTISFIGRYLSERPEAINERVVCYGEHYLINKLNDKVWSVVGVTRHCLFVVDLNDKSKQELVFDIYINGEYKRICVNDIQINEFCKRTWEKDKLADVLIKPVYREYVEVR